SNAAKGLTDAVKIVVGVFERLWNIGDKTKALLTVLGGAALYFISPWTALAGAIALVANSFELFLRGKDSAVGRIVYALYRIVEWAKTKWLEFKKDPFGSLRKWAGEFATWFADTIIAAIKPAVDRAI